MSLILQNFRHHAKYTLNISANTIHLINGDSGVGKSTIFDSILWVLYGKMKKVRTRACDSKSRAIVILSIGDRIITRKSNPDELIVRHGSVDLLGEAARLSIEDWLGPREFWLSTSYMRQKKPNIFLSSTPSQKLEILSQLVFMKVNPGIYIEKVDNKLLGIGREKALISSMYQRLCQEYSDLIKKYGFTEEDMSKGYPNDIEGVKLEDIVPYYTQLMKDIEEEKKKQTVNEIIHKEWTELASALTGIDQYYLDSLERDAKESIEGSQIEVTREGLLTKREELSRRITRIKEELSKLIYTEGIQPKIHSSHDIYITMKKEEEIETSRKAFEVYNIPYNSKDLEERRKEITTQISDLSAKHWEYQDYINRLRTYTNAKREIEELETRINEYEIKDLSVDNIDANIKQLYQELKINETKDLDRIGEIDRISSVQYLTCPHCDKCVFWSGNQLVKTQGYNIEELKIERYNILKEKDTVSKSIKDRLTSLEKELRERNRHSSLLRDMLTRREYLKSNLMQEPPFLEPIDKERFVSLKDLDIKLSQLRYIPLTGKCHKTMNMENNNYEYVLKLQELSKLEKELLELVIPEKVVCKYTRQEAYLELNRVQKLRTSLARYKEIKDVEVNWNEYTSLIKKLEVLSKGYQRAQSLIETLNKYSEYSVLYNKYQSICNDEMIHVRLRDVMINTEYSMYIEATNKINSVLQNTISSLFNEPIRVKLMMFKTLKDKGRIKPSVNIQAFYGNEEIDIDSFSGGEDERLSLAITLALNSISSSPFLILDESLASLSNNDREKAVVVLRDYGRKKDGYTLCVNHGGVEGWYDKETFLSKIIQ